jgi:hypothetical protein
LLIQKGRVAVGVKVIFTNRSVPHEAINVYPDWDFQDCVDYHIRLVQKNPLVRVATNYCEALVGSRDIERDSLDFTAPYWVIKRL